MLRVTSDQYLPLHLRQVFEDLWSTFASLNTEFTASLTEILRWRLKTSSVQSSLSWSFMCKYGKSGWVFSDGGAWSPAFTSVTFMSSMMLYVTCSWLVEGACWECLSVSVDQMKFAFNAWTSLFHEGKETRSLAQKPNFARSWRTVKALILESYIKIIRISILSSILYTIYTCISILHSRYSNQNTLDNWYIHNTNISVVYYLSILSQFLEMCLNLWHSCFLEFVQSVLVRFFLIFVEAFVLLNKYWSNWSNMISCIARYGLKVSKYSNSMNWR